MKSGLASRIILGAIVVILMAKAALAQSTEVARPVASAASSYQDTADDYNRRLAELNGKLSQQVPSPSGEGDRADYQIGSDDLLDISVLEAPELDRLPRVSASGEISLALVGTVRAGGLTTRELETVIEELLRRNYIKEPHVNVQVREMQSHAVAVFGAVKKPGVFQVRGPKTVVELLSMAEGLDVDAGEMVIVEHRGNAGGLSSSSTITSPVGVSVTDPLGVDASTVKNAGAAPNSGASLAMGAANAASITASFPSTVEIDLKKLLGTGDPRLNVLVYPGDVVKVPRADLVYVVGEVAKPGGFELKSNESVSVLQAIALAQGLTHTSASTRSRIIRTNAATGERQEIPIDINRVLAGKSADPMLEPRDIVFVPNSASRTALYRGVDAIFSIGSGVAVYRW